MKNAWGWLWTFVADSIPTWFRQERWTPNDWLIMLVAIFVVLCLLLIVYVSTI